MSISVLPKRNIVIPSPDGKESVRLNKDIISQVPDWAPKSPYYKALVADKKLLVMTGGKTGRGKKDEKEAEKSGDGGNDENAGESRESQ